MSLILTFLGEGAGERSAMAIAAAKKLVHQGKRVLLAGRADPVLGLLLGQALTVDPQELAPNLKAVVLQTTTLLERSWEDVKQLEAQYLKTPILKSVYGQELVVLPGMDSALALNALRLYDASGQYDVIVYDGSGDQTTLRMLGMPELLSWYLRRFRKVFVESDLGRTIAESPFIQPLVSTVLNVNWTGDLFAQPTNQVNNLLDQGREAISDPSRVAAYLVTTPDDLTIASARYLWGNAQQVGLTIGGVLHQGQDVGSLTETFAPLPVSSLPNRAEGWQALMDALPDLSQMAHAPKPIEVSVSERKVKLFLPGFTKQEVKLTQSGPEVTIGAGDQRRNILLPPELSGRSVTGAKFQDNYLIISF